MLSSELHIIGSPTAVVQMREAWSKEGWEELRGYPWDVRAYRQKPRSEEPAIAESKEALVPDPLLPATAVAAKPEAVFRVMRWMVKKVW